MDAVAKLPREIDADLGANQPGGSGDEKGFHIGSEAVAPDGR
jgi:hypothetical protein